MTGDGTNDAPRWLKPMSEVAMNTGTSAAREADNMVHGVRCAGRGRARSRPPHPPGRPGSILLWALGGDPRPGQRSEATAHYCLTYLPQ
jgi:hypothetical protein